MSRNWQRVRVYSQNRNTFLPFCLLLMLRYKYRKYEIWQNLAKLVLLCLKLCLRPENERAPPEKTYQILNIKLLVCLGLCLWPENERAPPEKTYQILNIKLLVCLGLCLWPENERAPSEKTYQILNIKLLVCLGLCLRSKNEICVYIIYDLWSRASPAATSMSVLRHTKLYTCFFGESSYSRQDNVANIIDITEKPSNLRI